MDDNSDLLVQKRLFNANIEKLEYLVSADVSSFLITSKALTNVTLLRLNVVKLMLIYVIDCHFMSL